jgi:hypothetical protein
MLFYAILAVTSNCGLFTNWDLKVSYTIPQFPSSGIGSGLAGIGKFYAVPVMGLLWLSILGIWGREGF